MASPKVGWVEQILEEVGVKGDHSRSIVVDQSSSPPLPSPPHHSTISKDMYSEEFESFWRCYPKKIGKGKAFEAWKKLKPPLQTCIEQIEAMRISDDWLKEVGQFIPHPTTWLNGRRWDDEKPKPRKRLVTGQDPRTLRPKKPKVEVVSPEELEQCRDDAATGMNNIIQELADNLESKGD